MKRSAIIFCIFVVGTILMNMAIFMFISKMFGDSIVAFLVGFIINTILDIVICTLLCDTIFK